LETSISYCGLNCDTCSIHLISRETDPSIKQKMINDIVHACREYYNIEYKYEDINGCDGCKFTNGILFPGCLNCKIRECANLKGVDNCAYCMDYACNNLSEMFKLDPSAKERLDKIREQYNQN